MGLETPQYPEVCIRIKSYTGTLVDSTYPQYYEAASRSFHDPTRRNIHSAAIISYTWFALLDHSPLGRKPTGEIRKFRDRLVAACQGNGDEVLGTNLPEVISNLAKLADTMLAIQGGKGIITPDVLKMVKRLPISKELLHCVRVVDPDVLQYVQTFLQWGKKAEWDDPDFDSTALRRWESVEEDLAGLVLDDFYVDGLKAMIALILPKSPQEYDFRPKFGPGHVYEDGIGQSIELKALDLAVKIRSMRSPTGRFMRSPLRAIWNRVSGVEGGTVTHVARTANSCAMRDYLAEARGIPARETNSENVKPKRVSKRRFVVKDVGTSRTIAMEESCVMYMQQGIRSRLDMAIEENLSRHVKLADQSVNREWAQQSSVDMQFDTLDLKDASDRQSWELVRRCYPREWVNDLRDTKADAVEYVVDETKIHGLKLTTYCQQHVHKFAPMGSAVCFPTETITFAAVIMLAAVLRRFEDTTQIPRSEWGLISFSTLFNSMGREHVEHALAMEDFGVYGDDLIVDRRTTPYVKQLLKEFGFMVSPTKCFEGLHPFRESCGGWYLRGKSIRPVRIRLKGISRNDGSKVLMSLVSTANQLYELSYRKARKAVINVIEQILFLWPDFTSLVNKIQIRVKAMLRKQKRQGATCLTEGTFVDGKLPIIYSNGTDGLDRYAVSLRSNCISPNGHLSLRWDADRNGVGSHTWQYMALQIKMEKGFDVDHVIVDPYLLDQLELALIRDTNMWHPSERKMDTMWSGTRKSLVNVEPGNDPEHAVCMPGWMWFAAS